MKLDSGHWLASRYNFYLLGHGLIVVAVICFFRIIPDTKIAALCAGTLFLLGPSWVILSEFKNKAGWRSLSFFAAALFLCLSALPILILRLANWGTPFSELSLLGFSGPELHQYSNHIYLIMLAAFAADSVWSRIKAWKTKTKSDQTLVAK